MIHENSLYGIHENVTLIVFGNGTVDLSPATNESDGTQHLVITNSTSWIVGAEHSDYLNKSTDEIPRPPVVMIFKSKESIDVLIERLQCVRSKFTNPPTAPAA